MENGNLSSKDSLKWENLAVFALSHLGLSREQFLDFYPDPVLIRERKKGIPISKLLKEKKAQKMVIPLEKLELQGVPAGLSDVKNRENEFIFLPFGQKNRIWIGRSSECEVVLNFPWVALRHASIHKEGEGWYKIEDLGAEGGTILNGVKLMAGIGYPIGDFGQLIFGKGIRYFFLTPNGFFNYLSLFEEGGD
ncbi:MAG: FHA domain-containing protein [Planctomycetota bacterium]|nr:MAG: FHA domain-containing protein [Planctomycetota bacterium]